MRGGSRFWIAGLLAIVAAREAIAQTAPAAEPPEAPHRGEGYLGAAFLFRLDSITVVYPARPGTDLDRNRRSAQARARFLRESHGVAAQVAPDNRLSDAERQGNLLLLGWDNALMGSEAVPAPYRRSAGALEFLGLTAADPDADLLVYHRSPLNPERFIVFWSRIDPENDRLMMLPGIGSDWAIVSGFRPLQQGMFVPGTTWPPKRDIRAEADHATAERGSRKTAIRKGDRYDIVYEPSRVSPQELEAIASAREAALRKAADLLGGKLDGYRVLLNVYDDESAKQTLTGVEGETHAIPRDHELYMTRRAARSSTPHEEFHLMARQAMGPCVVTSLYEGLAHFHQGTWRGGLDPLVSAALLSERGALPPVAALVDEEKFRALPESVAVPAATALYGWVRSFGPEPARRAYVIPEGSLAELGGALGKPGPELQAAFDAWLRARAQERASAIAFAKAEAEAQSRYAAGDYAGMAAALRRAVDAKPEDPQAIFNWASALMRAGALEEAAGALRRMMGLPLGPRESRFRIFGHYQLGRIYDLEGRREEALAAYRRVLELPDEHDAHRLARERIESPATKEQLE